MPTPRLAAYEPGAAFPLASLSFEAVERTSGDGGIRVVAYDAARTVKMILKVRPATITINIEAQNPPLATPAAVLLGLRFMQALHHPNTMMLTVRAGDHTETNRMDLPPGSSVGQMPQQAVEYIEDLAAIQDKLRQPFPLPPTFTPGDLDMASRLRRLLDGETVPWLRGPISITLDPTKSLSSRHSSRPVAAPYGSSTTTSRWASVSTWSIPGPCS